LDDNWKMGEETAFLAYFLHLRYGSFLHWSPQNSWYRTIRCKILRLFVSPISFEWSSWNVNLFLSLFEKTKYDERYVQFIVNESEENIQAAKKYLDDYLDLSFPEISESIRTKKVAFNILDY